MRALRDWKTVASILGISFSAATSAYAAAAETPAETILTHGEIYKADGGWAEALAIRRHLGDERGIAEVVGHKGLAAIFRGDVERAETLARGLAVLWIGGFFVAVEGAVLKLMH